MSTSSAIVERAAFVAVVAVVATSGCRNFGEPPAPLLSVSPLSLTFSGAAGDQSPPAQALSIGQLGSGVLTWAAQGDAPWLSLSSAKGTTPALTWVSAISAGLAAGSYSGTISVATGGESSEHVTVPVTFVVTASVSLTGRWVGVSDTVNLAMTLAESNGSVTGFGAVSPSPGTVAITGTHQGSAVSLTLVGGGATVTFAGSLLDGNAVRGTVDGVGLSGYQIIIFRQ